MKLENITTERIRKIEKLLMDASLNLCEIRIAAAHGDITVKAAAASINRIGAEIEKAIYPEKHNQ